MLLRLVKIALVLLFGTIVGMLLGFAYASHLFGADVVSNQIAHIVGGDAAVGLPPPASGALVDKLHSIALATAADAAHSDTPSLEGFQYATAAMIPKLGACIGFGIAASVLLGAVSFQILKTLISSAKSDVKAVPNGEDRITYVPGNKLFKPSSEDDDSAT